MGADAIHLVVDPVPFPIQIALDSESRKLIGHDPEAPAGGIGKGPVISKGNNLRRSLILISLAERAEPPEDLRSSEAKSEGLLPLSVEMITHLPWIGSFLNSGTSFFSLLQTDGLGRKTSPELHLPLLDTSLPLFFVGLTLDALGGHGSDHEPLF